MLALGRRGSPYYLRKPEQIVKHDTMRLDAPFRQQKLICADERKRRIEYPEC